MFRMCSVCPGQTVRTTHVWFALNRRPERASPGPTWAPRVLLRPSHPRRRGGCDRITHARTDALGNGSSAMPGRYPRAMPSVSPPWFEILFAEHRTAAIPDLWPWQKEVLSSYSGITGDVAVELPTGTGKTLVGLLAGEDFRQKQGGPVAYLAGNKQLAQQVERQARDVTFPVVRFQGSKDTWPARDVRAYNFGEAIGVMNYWNYFNANPGIEAAGLLILDDVHLLEGRLREFFTVTVPRSDPLNAEILNRIVARCPYYGIVEDLVNDIETNRPPEMLVFPDSADLAPEIRDLLDAGLVQWSDPWWAWQQIREQLEVCCWLISHRGITFTPYIPPAQTISHFATPVRRLHLSATIGSVDDLERRLGAPPAEKVTASVQPRQGERLILIRDNVDRAFGTELVDELRPLLEKHPKAVWLCARTDTAVALEFALTLSGLPGPVRRLERDNGADEPFCMDTTGHLVVAGRYDGMDFPDDTCRIEVVPELPIATSDLEEFASAYLRDAAFAETRFAQRVAQALGRCNRSENDRAVYILTDPGFVTRFSQKRSLDGLIDDVRADVFAGLERSDRGLSAGLEEAERFLAGEPPTAAQPPRLAPTEISTATGSEEVEAFLAMWRQDFGRAERICDRVASRLSHTREHRAFWLAMRALALRMAGAYGDESAARQFPTALKAAAAAGAASTFFTRLRLAEARTHQAEMASHFAGDRNDDLFTAWDALVTRHGASGPRLERWAQKVKSDLGSNDHDTVARAIAIVGAELLGLSSATPQATTGEHDAHWELVSPPRLLAFEVKLAPKAQKVINEDVEQAEGAVRALETQRSRPTRGLVVTPWQEADSTVLDRLDRVRVIQREVLIAEVDRLIQLLIEYRRGWTEDAAVRSQRRTAVEGQVPTADWLWRALEATQGWVQNEHLQNLRHDAPSV